MGKDSKERSQTDRFLAGGFTGFVVRTIVQPLDVLKIRFQLQHEPIKMSSHVSKYRSLPQSVLDIVREEGITSFWKGHVPAQLLSVTYTAVQFTSFNFFNRTLDQFLNPVMDTKIVTDVKGDAKSSFNYLISGSLSGMCGAMASHPFDTIRTRLVGQGEPKLYKSMTDAFVSMVRNEGMFSLFRGLKPNLILVAPQSGLTFVSYKFFKDLWTLTFEAKDGRKGDIIKNLFCGASSGIVSKTLVYPFDSIKKRLQVQGFEQARAKFGTVINYKSSVDCLIKIIRDETFLGLFKGYQPTLIKASVSTAINFALFEYLIGL